jgi:SAM-dependent methyltransferase
MAKDRKAYRDTADHYASLPEIYTEQYDPELLLTSAEYPANQFRLGRVIERLKSRGGIDRLVDLGLGEGTPAMRVRDAVGCEVWGMDYTAEMLEAAHANFAAHGADPDRLRQGDVQDWKSCEPLLADGSFDAALCLGVMPHVTDDASALSNIHRCLAPGGVAFVSFRNPLFNLFTMNRLTHEFIVDELMAEVDEGMRKVASDTLKQKLQMDRPPVRTVNERGGAGYDTVLARFHNPLTVGQIFAAAGFSDLNFHFYHYHPVAPWLEGETVDKGAFRKAAIGLEGETSGWRGYFMCSAYMVEAVAQ